MHFFKPNLLIRKPISPPSSIWEFPRGSIASIMSLFRFSSPTNDFQEIDTAELINLPLSLDEQITQKKIFLEEHIPSKSKIVLIGHSIGAYIILHLLKNCSRATDVTKSILLFPTIERMAISPSGRYVTPMVTYFKWFAIAAVTAFSCLPEFV